MKKVLLIFLNLFIANLSLALLTPDSKGGYFFTYLLLSTPFLILVALALAAVYLLLDALITNAKVKKIALSIVIFLPYIVLCTFVLLRYVHNQ